MKPIYFLSAVLLVASPSFANENLDFCQNAYEASGKVGPKPSSEACDCIVNTMNEHLPDDINAAMRKAMVTADQGEKVSIMMKVASENPNFGPTMEKWANAQGQCELK